MPRKQAKIRRRHLPSAFAELVRLHPPRVIHDETDYDNTQEIVDALTSIPHLSRGQSDYLETLSVLMEAYEEEHHAIDTSELTPLEMLKFLMEQHAMTSGDLGKLIGSASLASMILSGKREISKANIAILAKSFGVSAECFL